MTDVHEHLIDGDRCVVAFSSGGDRYRTERWEWAGTLSRIGVPHVLMRDNTDRWYQHGVAGIGGDLLGVVNYIRVLRARYGTVIALGLSSGAYAALMYGALAPVNTIIALSPITVKGPRGEEEFGPTWASRLWLPSDHPHVADLKRIYDNCNDMDRFVAPHQTPRMMGFVSDGDGTEIDARMFERLLVQQGDSQTTAHEGGGWSRVYTSSPHATLAMLPGFTHAQLGRGMRDSGLLQQLITGKV